MSLIIPTECGIVRFFYSAPGQSGLCETVFGMASTNSDGELNAGDLDNMSDIWDSNIMTSLSSEVTFIGADLEIPGEVHITNVRSTDGSQGGEMLPLTNAYLVRKLTALGGRQGRGHMFLPGVSISASNSDGTLNADFITGTQNSLDELPDLMAGHDLLPILFHADNSAVTAITSLQLVNLISTQRARLRN